MRGSRKHILDLLDREDYVERMNKELSAGGASVSRSDNHRPLGHNQPSEWSAEAFCSQFCSDRIDVDELTAWWPQVNPPQWDLISTCLIDGVQGILLVEGKAHEGECSEAGKTLAPDASQASKANHRQIQRCLRQAREGLRENGVFRLTTKRSYQLANRLAYMWKLASLGLPTVLLYLGFTGDTYFKRDYFVDNNHWQRVMGAYMKKVVPLGFPGQPVDIPEGASARLLVVSLEAQTSSSS